MTVTWTDAIVFAFARPGLEIRMDAAKTMVSLR